MDTTTVALIAASILGWSVASARLARADVTAPMAFVAVGLLADALGWVEVAPGSVDVRTIAEVTLVLLLFTDAARVDVRRLREDAGLPARLLGIGLPLTVLGGAAMAWWLFPDVGGWTAVLVAACLAPTDAGLGAAIVNDPAVPRRIRRTLNVESGLNDGIVAPLITFAIAAVAEEAFHEGGLLTEAAAELGKGTLTGLFVGLVGGLALSVAATRGWSQREALPIGALATAALAYTAALAVHGNGFVAAFVAGLAFSPSLGRIDQLDEHATVDPLALTELSGQLLAASVWFLFGAAIVGDVVADADGRTLVYAVLSLTVMRMLPVAAALVGTRLELPTTAFIGWFGPRGMASLVFALLALEGLGADGAPVLTVVGITVLLSVVAHGVSGAPLAAAYGRWSSERGADHAANAPTPTFTPPRWGAIGRSLRRGSTDEPSPGASAPRA